MSYSSKLSRRLRGLDKQKTVTFQCEIAPSDIERLKAVAVLRNGVVLHSFNFRSHYELRMALNPEQYDHSKTIPGDTDGFVTTKERFVNREEAKDVAFACGQIDSMFRRPLLSSDITW